MNDVKGPRPINTIAKWERQRTNIERPTGGHSIIRQKEAVALPVIRDSYFYGLELADPNKVDWAEKIVRVEEQLYKTIIRLLPVLFGMMWELNPYIGLGVTLLFLYKGEKMFADYTTNTAMLQLSSPPPQTWSPENRFNYLAEGKNPEEAREKENRDLVMDGLRIMREKYRRNEIGLAEYNEYIEKIGDSFPDEIKTICRQDYFCG